MIFYPSTSPPTNQKLTKSLTKSVETGTPRKTRRPPKGAAHKPIYEPKLAGKPAPSDSRRMPLPRATLRSREREGKGCAAGLTPGAARPAVAPRSAVGKDRLHARETSGGGGAHKRQG